MTAYSRPSPLPRVVAVGFNKCGTRSFAELFRRAGHNVVHHKVRDGWRARRVGRIMQDNLAAGRKVFDGIDGYTFYCDLIYSTPTGTFDGAFAFRQILLDYPDTILLLNIRDREQWIASRLNHGHGEFARREKLARAANSEEDLVRQWREEWDAHLSAVRSFMEERPEQFIEFDLDRDKPEQIAKRLADYRLNPDDFLDIGRTRGRRMGWLKRALKHFIAHNRPRRHK